MSASGSAPRLTPAVPAALALRRADDGTGDVFSLLSGSRGSALLFGLSPTELFRQALGRASAPARGRDPGAFPTDLRRGLLAPISRPGALVEVLAGVALGFTMRRESRVALLVESADDTASGFWHEGLSVAAARRVPLVLVLDGTAPHAHTSRLSRFVEKAPAYGIGGVDVAAGDPLEIFETVQETVARARSGEGPQMVEVTPQGAGADPVATLAGRLQWAEALETDEVRAWEREAEEDMENAWAEAGREATPTADDARSQVYPGQGPAAAPWSPPPASARFGATP